MTMTDRLADILVRRLVRAQEREALSGFERQGLVELTGPDEDGAPVGFRISGTRDEVMEALACRHRSHQSANSPGTTFDIGDSPMSLTLRAHLPEGIDVDDPMFDEALKRARLVRSEGNEAAGADRMPMLVDDPRGLGIVAPEQQDLRNPAVAESSQNDRFEGLRTPRGTSDYSDAWSSSDTTAVIRAMRSTAEPPRPDEVASVLLVAKAIRTSGISVGSLLDILAGARPIVVLISPLREVLVAILHLLEHSLILPGKYELKEGRGLLNAVSSWRSTWTTKRIITLTLEKDDVRKITRLGLKSIVSRIMAAREPVLVIADDLAAVPKRLVDAAHLVLDTGPVDAPTVNRTIQVCLGSAPVNRISDDLAASLDLTDLVTAIRPGATPDSAIEALRLYGAENTASDAEDDEPDARAGRHGDKAVGLSGTTATEAILIPPESDASGPTIDTVSGYGRAITWANELRLDLVDWKSGLVSWSDMSTRVLLAGPPGTGKSTFAKILGRSLGLPVFLSSPAHWLEPSSLGDVLRRMKRVFAEARARAPSILFVDEVDGLGSRMSDVSQPYASYHRNIINQALMLIDGTGASEGVILVGATNRPEDLDRALIRSGRFETRIDIPLPDEDALAGIIAHHVGNAPDQKSVGDAVFSAATRSAANAGVSGTGSVGSEEAQCQGDLCSEGHEDDQPRSAVVVDAPENASLPLESDLFRRLARAARGLTGADVERIVRTARQVARRAGRSILPSDLIDHFSQRHQALPRDLRWRMAVHEAGHVLTLKSLGFGEPVHAYINEGGGVTIAQMLNWVPTEATLSNLLIVFLAGRAAEEIVLGEVSAGAGGSSESDLGKATALACRMEAQFGFVSLIHNTDQEMAARLLADREFANNVRGRLERADLAARELLNKHTDSLMETAKGIMSE